MKRVLIIDSCQQCKYFSNIPIRNNKIFDKYYCFYNSENPFLIFKIGMEDNNNEFKIPITCKLKSYGEIMSALRILGMKSHAKKRAKERINIYLNENYINDIIEIINKNFGYEEKGQSRSLNIYELNNIKIKQTLTKKAHIVYYKKINKTFLLIYNKKYKEIVTILKELNSINDIINFDCILNKNFNNSINLFCPNELLNENIYKYPYNIFLKE